MTYAEALVVMEHGKKVSRASWGSLYGWYYVTKEDKGLVMNDPINGMPALVNCWEFTPSVNDLEAHDWEIVNKIREWR